MEDAVRPNITARRNIFERGFRTWSSLADNAVKATALPESCFEFQKTIAHIPRFPLGLDIKERYGGLYATGTSVWATQGSQGLSYIEKNIDILVSTAWPTKLTLADRDLDYRTWFNHEENHISILVLAWAYILSARWAELMPGSVVEYNSDQVARGESDQDAILVDVGNIDNGATRWWAAVLAPEGWQAYISSDKAKYKSPWSIALKTSLKYRLSCHEDPMQQASAISPTAALCYLSEYCDLHGITDQSYAALSVTLMLPLLSSRGRQVRLPLPKLRYGRNAGLQQSTQADNKWLYTTTNLDKILVLSCNTGGLKSLLSSIFYDPGVTCNLASSWLHAIFAVLDSVNATHLIYIMAKRSSPLAFLWLGGIITGLYDDILRDGRSGLIPVDLHAAMWTGTIQSFLQEPLSKPSTMMGSISRANECRLLYILQEKYHDRWPTCQWAPFGQTALEDTNERVRSYADEFEGGFRYVEWRWACKEGGAIHYVPNGGLTPVFQTLPHAVLDIHIGYEALKDEEIVSENATRNIFGWLRPKGFSANEKDIYRHEWLAGEVSDEDAHYEGIQRAERLRPSELEQPK
ncbi:hypothetical protein MauCBS54593_004574 [Microsporum audouinii]